MKQKYIQMEKKVEKELEEAKEDIKDAISAEKKRTASVSKLKSESLALDSSLTGLQESTHDAKNRLWKKCAKWIILAALIVLIVGGLLAVYIYDKVK